MKFEKLHDGIAGHDQSYALINRGFSAETRSAGQWFETTAEIYDNFLNILPPMDYTADGFSMSEFATGSLTDAFLRHGGRFFYLSINRERSGDFTNAVRAFRDHLAFAERTV
ncbi:DUF1419 domain-containing protein [Paracoccus zhejiangensis]|uniref:Uncharacterized protein n=1 Tax=Paracoccus zhejiangensis TaxID=1077935 RepID=A0A2H5F5U9_9RHOB|nr:DUF1419 domain-containing protein [Paracoccus zhejiangensis]AUH66928.1 hypothetical protein CX676_21740 [Paracoccus zhejiangensis]